MAIEEEEFDKLFRIAQMAAEATVDVIAAKDREYFVVMSTKKALMLLVISQATIYLGSGVLNYYAFKKLKGKRMDKATD